MEVAAADLAELTRAAIVAHQRVWTSASGMGDDDCRETEIHHVDLDAGYTHEHWPAEFVRLMLPRVLPTLDARLADGITIQVQVTDRDWPQAGAMATETDDLVVVRGTASAVLCWLTGRPVPAAAGLTASRSGQGWPLPRLRPWA